MKSFKPAAGIAFLAIFAVASGCGGANENLSEVTGQITLDGEPLPNAFVVFSPTSGGTTSYGRTGDDGRYQMMFRDDEYGAWIGENRVEISTGDVGATGGAGAREVVPAVYNRNTTLKVEVKPGSNVFDFPLESDAGKVIQLPEE